MDVPEGRHVEEVGTSNMNVEVDRNQCPSLQDGEVLRDRDIVEGDCEGRNGPNGPKAGTPEMQKEASPFCLEEHEHFVEKLGNCVHTQEWMD